MHTCAHPQPAADAQWLGIAPGEPGGDRTEQLLMCTGTLARDAEMRTKPTGPQGDPAPVLCLDLQDVVPHTAAVHVEQVFAPSDRRRAEALAARLKKGMRVTARCLLRDVRLSLPAAFGIEPQPAQPSINPSPTTPNERHPRTS